MSKGMRTEDEVRDSAKLVLGFDREESGVQQGTGQITTFNQLGFRGCNDKPDGWYLPDDASKPAIILETKSEAEGVSKEKHVKELFKNIDVVAKKYSKTIGILYSGSAIRVFRNKLQEEVAELLEAYTAKERSVLDCAEEMADVMEVLYAMGKTCAVSKREIEQVRSQKASEKGTFGKRVFLVSTGKERSGL